MAKEQHLNDLKEAKTDCDQPKESLLERLSLMQVAIDSLPIPIFYSNITGKYLGCNKAFEKLTGLPKERIINKSVYNLMQKGIADTYSKAEQNLFLRGSQSYEERVIYSDGSQHEFASINATFSITDGTIAGLVGTFFDITDYKNAEQTLRYHLTFYETLIGCFAGLIGLSVDQIGEGINGALGRIGNFISADRCYILLSSPDGAFLSDTHKWYAEGAPPLSHKLHELRIDDYPLFYDVIRNGKSICISDISELSQYTQIDKDILQNLGTQSMLVVPMISQGRVLGLMSIDSIKAKEVWHEDDIILIQVAARFLASIIMQKQVEMQLIETKEQLRLILDGSNDIFWDWHIINGSLHFNQNLTEILGYSPDELDPNKTDWQKLIHLSDMPIVMKKINSHLEGNTVYYESEHRLLAKSRIWKWVLVRGKVIMRNEYGKPVRMVGTITDITERKKMEKELLETEKLRSLGVFSGGIARNFDNALMTIINNIYLAKSFLDSKNIKEAAEKLNNGETACQQLKDLIQQLVTFSEGSETQKIVSIAELLKKSVSLALNDSNLRCEFSIANDLWECSVDEEQISQVIQNLIINLKQFVSENVIIQIKAENTDIEGTNTIPLPDRKYVKVSINSQGFELPEEYLRGIFEPFSNVKQGIDDMGLAVSYSIIKKHQGYIMAKSEQGSGVTFTFFLPAIVNVSLLYEFDSRNSLERKDKILVMENSEPLRIILTQMLTYLGYDVEMAKDISDMTELYKGAKDSDHSISTVILDLPVSELINSKEIIKSLVDIDPEVKVIASCGHQTAMSDIAELKKHGFKEVLIKPYKLKELSGVLQNVIANNH
jgi:PAS domain S-box-containing protein